MTTTFIYTLEHPITNEIRYVGKSNNPIKRLSAHIRDGKNKNTHKANWIKSLLNEGLRPKVDILEEVSIEDWKYWEMYWIAQMKAWGFKLTNLTDGGDCGPIISGMLGKHHTEEAKQKIREKRALQILPPLSEEARKQIGLKHKGKIITEEHKNKLRINHKGGNFKPHSEEAKKRMSYSAKNRKRQYDKHI